MFGMVHPKLQEFIEKYRLHGFYIDVHGHLCIQICAGKRLLTALVNFLKDYELYGVFVDEMSDRGLYENQIVLYTAHSQDELYQTICKAIKKYNTEGENSHEHNK